MRQCLAMPRTAPSSLASVASLVALLSLGSLGVACGGRTLYDNADGGQGAAPSASATSTAPPDPSQVTPPGPPPAPLPVPTMSLAEACGRICERDAKCGAWRVDCEERCHARASDGCGADRWLRCYGEHIDECAALPPACETAYCAWAACAGEKAADVCD